MTEPSSAAVDIVAANNQPALDALLRAIVLVDLSGAIVGWNLVSERFYGWSGLEAVGRQLVELICPVELRDAGRQLLNRAFAGDDWNGMITATRRDGSAISTSSFLGPLRDGHGRIIGAVGVADEANELTRLQREKSELTDHLLLALAAGELGTWSWDMQTGVTVWDAATERLFGAEPGTFGGTYEDYVALLHPEDIERTLAVVALAIAEKSSYSVDHRVFWQDGSIHWLQGRGKVITDERGNATGTIGCISDVADRKLAEANAVRRVNEAERAARTERRERERMEFLAGLNDIALGAPDHLELMRRAADAAVPRLGDWCTVHFMPEPGVHETEDAHVEPERAAWAKQMRIRYPYDPDGVMGIAATMRSGKTEYWPDLRLDTVRSAITGVTESQLEALGGFIEYLHLTSMISVPLITKRGVVGVIQFVSAESQRHYDAHDVTLAEAAAGRIAEALDNAWLVEQQRKISKTLQAALLPDRLPDLPGITIAARYWAAGVVSEVGGDFYDVFQIRHNCWALVIGDVCGTGPHAAAVTAVARHTIRAAATHGIGHVDVLHWVNEAILQGSTDLFCTLLYSTLELLDDGSWLFTSVAGGHPLPILTGPGVPTATIGVHGTLIGILPRISVTPTSTILPAGSTLLLHTDGVNDIAPPYDLDEHQLRLLVSAAAGDGGSADDIAERIGDSIAAILPIPQRDDDVAIVVVHLG